MEMAGHCLCVLYMLYVTYMCSMCLICALCVLYVLYAVAAVSVFRDLHWSKSQYFMTCAMGKKYRKKEKKMEHEFIIDLSH